MQSRVGRDGEEALVARARRGEQSAFAALYDAHAGRMLGMARRLLGTPHAAEDLVHDVFIEAWRALESYDPARGSVGAWLGARLRSRAIDRLRRVRRSPESGASVEASATEDMERKVDAGRLPDWLAELPAPQRQAVALAYLGGLTAKEIAESQGVPEGTVKARISRGLAKLRDLRRLEEPR